MFSPLSGARFRCRGSTGIGPIYCSHARRITVKVAHRLAQTGLLLLGTAMVGVVLLILDVVAGPAIGVISGGGHRLVAGYPMGAVPMVLRRKIDHRPSTQSSHPH